MKGRTRRIISGIAHFPLLLRYTPLGVFLRKSKEELTSGSIDLSLNKLNIVHPLYPHIHGDNIFISCKEQRFDTADIDLKGRYDNMMYSNLAKERKKYGNY